MVLKEDKSVRLFFGIPVSNEVRDYVDAIEASNPDLKWIKGNDLHITLVFIGNVGQQVADILTSLELTPAPAFSVTVEKAEVKNRKGSGLIWLKCSSSPGIRLLRHELLRAAGPFTTIKEAGRPFNPHITIARSNKKIEHIPEQPPAFTFVPESFVLYQSKKEADRKYKVLRDYPLIKKAPFD